MRLPQNHQRTVSRMTDLIISAIGLGICVAGIAYLILKGGSDDD